MFPALQPADKRGEVVRFEEGFTVINDSYNSSPAALNELDAAAGGDAGVSAPHSRSGGDAGAGNFVGGIASPMRAECRRAWRASTGFLACRGRRRIFCGRRSRPVIRRGARNFLRTPARPGKFLAAFLQRGDLLLLKGSRGVKMEKILEAIEAAASARGGRRFAAALGEFAERARLRCFTTCSSTCCGRISARSMYFATLPCARRSPA